jgi:hypothetical protein
VAAAATTATACGRDAVLCCAVLCCAVLCCAVLCCAVLCCAVLCCAVLCCAVLWQFKKDLEQRKKNDEKRAAQAQGTPTAAARQRLRIRACATESSNRSSQLRVWVCVVAALKERGNTEFRAKKYDEALRSYRKSLKLVPFEAAVLTNIAQVRQWRRVALRRPPIGARASGSSSCRGGAQACLRATRFDDAVEFCNRALFVDAKNVKALFRRALARKALLLFSDAISDLQAAAAIEPLNDDLALELKSCRVCSGGFLVSGAGWFCSETVWRTVYLARGCDFLLVDVVQLAMREHEKEAAVSKRLSLISVDSGVAPSTSSGGCGDGGGGDGGDGDADDSSGEVAARTVRVTSSIDPTLSSLANLGAVVARLLPRVASLTTVEAWVATCQRDGAAESPSSQPALEADLRALGACLNDDEAHVMVRMGGLLARLCDAVTTLLRAACAAELTWSAALSSSAQAALLSVAATLENAANCSHVLSCGVMSLAMDLCTAAGGDGSAATATPHKVLTAAMALVEVRGGG